MFGDVTFEPAGLLQIERVDGSTINGVPMVVSSAPRVVKCTRCKALVLADDTDDHSSWHRLAGIGMG